MLWLSCKNYSLVKIELEKVKEISKLGITGYGDKYYYILFAVGSDKLIKSDKEKREERYSVYSDMYDHMDFICELQYDNGEERDKVFAEIIQAIKLDTKVVDIGNGSFIKKDRE